MTFRVEGNIFARVGKGGKSGKNKRKQEKNEREYSTPRTVAGRAGDGGEIIVPRNEALERFEKPADENAVAREARELGVTTVKILAHVAAVILLVLVGVVAHYFIKEILGDPKAADILPIRYVVELGDVAIILALVVKLIVYILKGEKKELKVG